MSNLDYTIDDSSLSDGLVIVKFDGSVDPGTVERFEEGMNGALNTAMEKDCRNIRVNFSDLEYINSSGLRVILTVTKATVSRKISIKFVELSEDVYMIFEQVGYCRIFDISKA